MATPTVGILHSSATVPTTGQTDQLVANVANMIMQTGKAQRPLFFLTHGQLVNKKLSPIKHLPTYGPTFKLFEQHMLPDSCVASAAHTAAVTTINVDAAQAFTRGDVFEVEENPGGTIGEQFIVDGAGTTSFSVPALAANGGRGAFGTTANAISINAVLRCIGNVVGEAGTRTRGSIIPLPESHTGCIQYFVTEWGMTAARLSMKAYWDNDYKRIVTEKVMDFTKRIEFATLCNSAADITSTSLYAAAPAGAAGVDDYGTIFYKAEGLNGRVTTNRFTGLAGANWGQLVDALGQAVISNEGEQDYRWMAFCSTEAMAHMAKWGEDRLQTRPGDNSYGFTPRWLNLPAGYGGVTALPVMWAPMLDRTRFKKGMMILSVGSTAGRSHMAWRYLQEVDGPRKKNWDFSLVTDDGIDIGQNAGYTARILRRIESMGGPEINMEKKHVIIDELAA